jgi:hypothetical protein
MTENIDQQDVIETPAPTEEVVETPAETPSENPSLEEEVTRLQKEKDGLDVKNKKLYARLKESEKTPKKTEEVKTNVENLPLKDIRALNDVHDEDVDWLISYAKFNDVTISEAKKREDVGIFLKTMEEKRQTAAATVIKTGNRGSQPNTGEEILKRARKGDLPQTESEIDDLVEAEWKLKMKNVK